MNAKDIAEKLRQERDGIWRKLTNSLVEEGFTIKASPTNQTDGKRAVAEHESRKGWYFPIRVEHKERRGSPAKNRLEWGKTGYRERFSHTVMIDDAAIARVVAEAKADLFRVVQSEVAAKQKAERVKHFNEQKKRELANISVPPGISIQILDDGSDAGKYTMVFEPHDNPLSAPMTVDQLSQLFFFIDSFSPTHEFREGREVMFDLEGRKEVTGTIIKAGTRSVLVQWPNPNLEGSFLSRHFSMGSLRLLTK